jgi:hypothetical protein
MVQIEQRPGEQVPHVPRRAVAPRFTGGTFHHSRWPKWIEDRAVAKLFVRNLWKALWNSSCEYAIRFGSYTIDDKDLEIAVNVALRADKYGYTIGRVLPHQHVPAVMAVAQDMVKAYFQNQEYRDLTGRQLANKWMPVMGQALR